jgi:hypothetical protein
MGMYGFAPCGDHGCAAGTVSVWMDGWLAELKFGHEQEERVETWELRLSGSLGVVLEH